MGWAASNIRLMTQSFEKKGWKNKWSQIDPESFQEGSQRSRTSKYIKKHPFRSSWSFRKKFKISTKTYHSDEFWDSFFSFSSCWRMCCLRRASRTILKWLVEHISVLFKEEYGGRAGLVLIFENWDILKIWDPKNWIFSKSMKRFGSAYFF